MHLVTSMALQGERWGEVAPAASGLCHRGRWAEGQEWLRVRRPSGTPYVWCSYDLPVASDLHLCEHLLDSERVLLMPGWVTLRITFARPSAVLADGLSRVERAAGPLQSLR